MTRAPHHPLIVTPAELSRNWLRCPHCGGIGEVPTGRTGMWGPVYGPCRDCDGTGRRALPECGRCDDSGYLDVDDPAYGLVCCDCETGRRAAAVAAERDAAGEAADAAAPY